MDVNATSCVRLVYAAFASESWQIEVRFQELEKQAGNMMTDPISDMLSRIRNASMVRKANVEMPHSKLKFALAKILEKEGYVGAVATDGEKRPMLRIDLKYTNGESVIRSIKRISKPGRRMYARATELPTVNSGTGIAVVSTPNGLMTNKEARKRRLGGEIICEVF